MRVGISEVEGRRAVLVLDGSSWRRTPWADLSEMLSEGSAGLEDGHALDEWPVVVPGRWCAPVATGAQVVGVGANYVDHRHEGGIAGRLHQPLFFALLPGSAVGHEASIVLPSVETCADYEVELAVVVGRTMKAVTPEQALSGVFGYTIANDVSARQVMAKEPMDIMMSKSIDTFLPIGPYVVTADEVGDPQTLGLRTWVNGELRQSSSTANMKTSVAELLSLLSQSVTLRPGDILATGTPAGVGSHMDPPRFLLPGDVVTMEIDAIGTLANQVVAGWMDPVTPPPAHVRA